MCAGIVLPGKLSIHPTLWFIAQESAHVILLKTIPAPLPPRTMLINPQGTKNVAIGSTSRFANRKYGLACPNVYIVIGKVPIWAATEIITVPRIKLNTFPFQWKRHSILWNSFSNVLAKITIATVAAKLN